MIQPNPDPRINEPTVGKVLLSSRGMFMNDYMFWVCVGALCAYSLIFTIFFILALTYLNRKFMFCVLCFMFMFSGFQWKFLIDIMYA